MKKAIIVVEGQTEQIFVEKFITKLVATQPIHLELRQLVGGSLLMLSPRGVPLEHASHHIRIIDVSNDEKVNSFIDGNLDDFIAKNFKIVYGLRDRFTGNNNKPKPNVDKIDAWCRQKEIDCNVTLEIIIAIEEVEAWFLSVPDFFMHYDASLTLTKVNEILDCDLSTIPIESLPHPSQTINKILSTVNQPYKKRLDDAHKIANCLNYELLYLEKINSIPPLKKLIDAIENCLT